MRKTVLSWSSGKDSAWALHLLRQRGFQVIALLTTVDARSGRVPVHNVSRVMLEEQARSAGLALWTVPIHHPCSNAEYEAALAPWHARALREGAESVSFGDLFLQDIRQYRERTLAGTGLTPEFPLWGRETAELAREMIAGGLRARVVSGCFAGREFDANMLSQLPTTVDPCGENGEFHTFAYDGPMFSRPVRPRIVSMIASATEIVAALGQVEHLAGRSHECDYPPEVLHLPVCTRPRIDVSGSSRDIDGAVKASASEAISIYEVFDSEIQRLQPTHILTQTQCDVCAVSLKDVERSLGARLPVQPEVVSLQPDSLAAIWDDIRRVACALDIPDRGEALVAELQARMCAISERALAQPSRPRVACIEWIEPLMAAGNWTPELVALAGGENLFGEAGKHSPWMTWDDLVSADPDVIVVMPCGFDLARAQAEMYWLTSRPEWPKLRARVYVADGNQYFNRPGPRVVETLQILAEMLHPAAFPAAAGMSLAYVGWRGSPPE